MVSGRVNDVSGTFIIDLEGSCLRNQVPVVCTRRRPRLKSRCMALICSLNLITLKLDAHSFARLGPCLQVRNIFSLFGDEGARI